MCSQYTKIHEQLWNRSYLSIMESECFSISTQLKKIKIIPFSIFIRKIFYLFGQILGMEPRVLYRLGKCSPPEPYFQPLGNLLKRANLSCYGFSHFKFLQVVLVHGFSQFLLIADLPPCFSHLPTWTKVKDSRMRGWGSTPLSFPSPPSTVWPLSVLLSWSVLVSVSHCPLICFSIQNSRRIFVP